MDLGLKTESFASDDTSWVRLRHGTDSCVSGTLDVSTFTEAVHFPDGFIKSGTAVGKITATGLYGPYASQTNEVQTITEGGSGLTSFTLTWNGQTTASLDDQATAAQIKAALEALSNIPAGSITVTGNAGGPYTVTFGGLLGGTNVAQMTATPTGGTGTVTIATTTAGGANPAASDGTETLFGHVMFGVKVNPADTTKNVGCAIFWHGGVVNSRLPVPVDAAGKADVAGRIQYFD
jgi:hypothetical protein